MKGLNVPAQPSTRKICQGSVHARSIKAALPGRGARFPVASLREDQSALEHKRVLVSHAACCRGSWVYQLPANTRGDAADANEPLILWPI